jgi:hypothetical protein
LRRVAQFLGLPYDRQMAEGHGNRDGVAEREHGWKASAFQRITGARVGVWRSELSADQVAHLERRGGYALKSLGYELATDGSRPLPWGFFWQLFWKRLTWRTGGALQLAAKELFGR